MEQEAVIEGVTPSDSSDGYKADESVVSAEVNTQPILPTSKAANFSAIAVSREESSEDQPTEETRTFEEEATSRGTPKDTNREQEGSDASSEEIEISLDEVRELLGMNQNPRYSGWLGSKKKKRKRKKSRSVLGCDDSVKTADTADTADKTIKTSNKLRKTKEEKASPEKSVSEELLPPEKPTKPTWKAVVDATSGKTYYYNRESRKTTWSKPDMYDEDWGAYELADKKYKEFVNADEKSEDKIPINPDGTADQHTPRKPGKPTWKAVEDQSTGKEYYFNRETLETTWKKPGTFDEQLAAYNIAKAAYYQGFKPEDEPQHTRSSNSSVQKQKSEEEDDVTSKVEDLEENEKSIGNAPAESDKTASPDSTTAAQFNFTMEKPEEGEEVTLNPKDLESDSAMKTAIVPFLFQRRRSKDKSKSEETKQDSLCDDLKRISSETHMNDSGEKQNKEEAVALEKKDSKETDEEKKEKSAPLWPRRRSKEKQKPEDSKRDPSIDNFVKSSKVELCETESTIEVLDEGEEVVVEKEDLKEDINSVTRPFFFRHLRSKDSETKEPRPDPPVEDLASQSTEEKNIHHATEEIDSGYEDAVDNIDKEVDDGDHSRGKDEPEAPKPDPPSQISRKLSDEKHIDNISPTVISNEPITSLENGDKEMAVEKKNASGPRACPRLKVEDDDQPQKHKEVPRGVGPPSVCPEQTAEKDCATNAPDEKNDAVPNENEMEISDTRMKPRRSIFQSRRKLRSKNKGDGHSTKSKSKRFFSSARPKSWRMKSGDSTSERKNIQSGQTYGSLSIQTADNMVSSTHEITSYPKEIDENSIPREDSSLRSENDDKQKQDVKEDQEDETKHDAEALVPQEESVEDACQGGRAQESDLSSTDSQELRVSEEQERIMTREDEAHLSNIAADPIPDDSFDLADGSTEQTPLDKCDAIAPEEKSTSEESEEGEIEVVHTGALKAPIVLTPTGTEEEAIALDDTSKGVEPTEQLIISSIKGEEHCKEEHESARENCSEESNDFNTTSSENVANLKVVNGAIDKKRQKSLVEVLSSFKRRSFEKKRHTGSPLVSEVTESENVGTCVAFELDESKGQEPAIFNACRINDLVEEAPVQEKAGAGTTPDIRGFVETPAKEEKKTDDSVIREDMKEGVESQKTAERDVEVIRIATFGDEVLLHSTIDEEKNKTDNTVDSEEKNGVESSKNTTEETEVTSIPVDETDQTGTQTDSETLEGAQDQEASEIIPMISGKKEQDTSVNTSNAVKEVDGHEVQIYENQEQEKVMSEAQSDGNDKKEKILIFESVKKTKVAEMNTEFPVVVKDLGAEFGADSCQLNEDNRDGDNSTSKEIISDVRNSQESAVEVEHDEIINSSENMDTTISSLLKAAPEEKSSEDLNSATGIEPTEAISQGQEQESTETASELSGGSMRRKAKLPFFVSFRKSKKDRAKKNEEGEEVSDPSESEQECSSSRSSSIDVSNTGDMGSESGSEKQSVVMEEDAAEILAPPEKSETRENDHHHGVDEDSMPGTEPIKETKDDAEGQKMQLSDGMGAIRAKEEVLSAVSSSNNDHKKSKRPFFRSFIKSKKTDPEIADKKFPTEPEKECSSLLSETSPKDGEESETSIQLDTNVESKSAATDISSPEDMGSESGSEKQSVVMEEDAAEILAPPEKSETLENDHHHGGIDEDSMPGTEPIEETKDDAEGPKMQLSHRMGAIRAKEEVLSAVSSSNNDHKKSKRPFFRSLRKSKKTDPEITDKTFPAEPAQGNSSLLSETPPKDDEASKTSIQLDTNVESKSAATDISSPEDMGSESGSEKQSVVMEEDAAEILAPPEKSETLENDHLHGGIDEDSMPGTEPIEETKDDAEGPKMQLSHRMGAIRAKEEVLSAVSSSNNDHKKSKRPFFRSLRKSKKTDPEITDKTFPAEPAQGNSSLLSETPPKDDEESETSIQLDTNVESKSAATDISSPEDMGSESGSEKQSVVMEEDAAEILAPPEKSETRENDHHHGGIDEDSMPGTEPIEETKDDAEVQKMQLSDGMGAIRAKEEVLSAVSSSSNDHKKSKRPFFRSLRKSKKTEPEVTDKTFPAEPAQGNSSLLSETSPQDDEASETSIQLHTGVETESEERDLAVDEEANAYKVVLSHKPSPSKASEKVTSSQQIEEALMIESEDSVELVRLSPIIFDSDQSERTADESIDLSIPDKCEVKPKEQVEEKEYGGTKPSSERDKPEDNDEVSADRDEKEFPKDGMKRTDPLYEKVDESKGCIPLCDDDSVADEEKMSTSISDNQATKVSTAPMTKFHDGKYLPLVQDDENSGEMPCVSGVSTSAEKQTDSASDIEKRREEEDEKEEVEPKIETAEDQKSEGVDEGRDNQVRKNEAVCPLCLEHQRMSKMNGRSSILSRKSTDRTVQDIAVESEEKVELLRVSSLPSQFKNKPKKILQHHGDISRKLPDEIGSIRELWAKKKLGGHETTKRSRSVESDILLNPVNHVKFEEDVTVSSCGSSIPSIVTCSSGCGSRSITTASTGTRTITSKSTRTSTGTRKSAGSGSTSSSASTESSNSSTDSEEQEKFGLGTFADIYLKGKWEMDLC